MNRNGVLAVMCVIMIMAGVIATLYGLVNRSAVEASSKPPSKVELIEAGRDITVYRYTDETGTYMIFCSGRQSMTALKVK